MPKTSRGGGGSSREEPKIEVILKMQKTAKSGVRVVCGPRIEVILKTKVP